MKKGINPSFINNLWIEKFESQADWSGLDTNCRKQSYKELLKSEWTEENELFFENFDETFRKRCMDRMVMGAMRYGTMSGGQYKTFDSKYYFSRLIGASEISIVNLEGFYDYGNVLFLLHKCGKTRKAVIDGLKIAMLQCYNSSIGTVGYFPKDRG